MDLFNVTSAQPNLHYMAGLAISLPVTSSNAEKTMVDKKSSAHDHVSWTFAKSSALAACLRINRLLTRRPIPLSKMLMCLFLKSERKLVFCFLAYTFVLLWIWHQTWLLLSLLVCQSSDPAHQCSGVYMGSRGQNNWTPCSHSQQRGTGCIYNVAWFVRRIVLGA